MTGKSHARVIEGLFLRCSQAVERYARRILKDSELAEDVVQESFLRVWKTAQDNRLRDEPDAYLFRTALNLARDEIRKRAAAARLFDEASEDVARQVTGFGDAETNLIWRDRLMRLEAVLAMLEPFTQHVFLLHHRQGLSVPAIADRMNKSSRTIERHLARALAHCAEWLDKDTLG